MKNEHNPKIELIQDAPILLKRPQKKKKKEDPLKNAPWHMYAEYGNYSCPVCKQTKTEVFVIEKSFERAKEIFNKKKGFCGDCMASMLSYYNFRYRICTITGYEPNPLIEKSEIPTEKKEFVNRMPLSPFRVFAFKMDKPPKAAVHIGFQKYYVIAVEPEDAKKKLNSYGQCAVCLCELLTLDRYCIQTVDGGRP